MNDERNDLAIHTSLETTRRRFLRAATGGFALAASGLFLPEPINEAEAREGALAGAKGGRHGKNHKGRHRHRTHGNKKDKGRPRDDAPRDHGPFRATALTVVNRWGPPLECTFYYQIKTGLDEYALPIANGDRTVLNNESFRYDPNRYRVGVLIKHTPGWQDFYADVRNISYWFPRGSLSSGDNLDPPSGKTGGYDIPEQAFTAGETHQHAFYTLKRKDDSADRIEWELVVHDFP